MPMRNAAAVGMARRYADSTILTMVVRPSVANPITGITLFEVAVSAAILLFVAVVVFLSVTTSLRTQQQARLQIAASSRMMQLSQAWAHADNRFADLCLERAEMAALGTEVEHDLERRLFLQVTPPYGGKEGHYAGWGNVGVVPPSIVARLDSENDEIRRVLADGGQLYYFRPGSGIAGRHGGEHEGTTSATGDNQLDSETRKLVFAVRGKPQQNGLRNHPALDWPTHESYPGPPQPHHRRTWAWNIDHLSPTQLSSTVTGVGRVKVLAGGSSFAQPPKVVIEAPVSGRRATARAIVNLGRLSAVEVTDPGYGYTVAPTVTLVPVDGGIGASVEAVTTPLSMALVDYGAADADSEISQPKWTIRYPGVTWRSSDRLDCEAAFNQLYDYCYHFRTPGIDATLDDRTWVDAPHTKLVMLPQDSSPLTVNYKNTLMLRIPPKDRLGYIHGKSSSYDDWRDPVNRFGHAGYWLTQIQRTPGTWTNWTGTVAKPGYAPWVGACPSVPSEPFYQRIDLAIPNYDNPVSENASTGSGGRLHQLLFLAQQLVRLTMIEGPAGASQMTYEDVVDPVDPVLGVRWPLPHPPQAIPVPVGGWQDSNEQVFPPPFKIQALSYLAWAAHTATRVAAPANPVGDANWDQGGGIRSITVLVPGSGYSDPPRVVLSGGPGHGCVAVAQLDPGTKGISAVRILNQGYGYDPAQPPTVSFVGAATAPATGEVSATDIKVKWPDPGSAAAEVARLQAYALALNDRCRRWVARYASADPYDWGAPRPANRATAWDFPLLQSDVLPKGYHRPDQTTRDRLPYVDDTTVRPNSGDADLSGLPALLSLFDRSVAGGGTQSMIERWRIERDRPAWRRGVPYTIGVPSGAAAEDVDRTWKIIAPRQPVNWGPSWALDGWNRDRRISQHVLPPGSPGEIEDQRQAGSMKIGADWDNTANLRYSWGDHNRFNLLAPFNAAERAREVVFWSVDWQQYEDFETAYEAVFDARSYSSHSDSRSPRSQQYAPDIVETRLHAVDSSYAASSVGEFDNAGSFSEGATTRIGVIDRNGNGRAFQEDYTKDVMEQKGYKPDIGPLRVTTRLSATLVARFLYYDGRVISGLRQ